MSAASNLKDHEICSRPIFKKMTFLNMICPLMCHFAHHPAFGCMAAYRSKCRGGKTHVLYSGESRYTGSEMKFLLTSQMAGRWKILPTTLIFYYLKNKILPIYTQPFYIGYYTNIITNCGSKQKNSHRRRL